MLYRSPISGAQQMANSTPEHAKAGMEAWMAWAGRAGSAIVDLGSPLGESVTVGGSTPTGTGFIGGYSVLQAESMGAVKKHLDGHPHLMMPGFTIEVLEYLPIPGM